MNKIQAKRLKQLADYLRTVDEKQFHMGSYMSVFIDSEITDGLLDCGISVEALVSHLFDEPDQRHIDQVKHQSYADLMSKFTDVKHVCGTAACALGYATCVWPEAFTLIPGLIIVEACEDNYRVDPTTLWINPFAAGIADYPEEVGFLPCGNTSRLLTEFFGLGYHVLERAFGPYDDRTPQEEADLLESLITKYTTDSEEQV